ncbi:acetyltransferase [Oceanispirochaeta crateris]|uniref:Acetyltransferase n=1 Tax=Oceanispirochaeta crateris TaxID=2518645 RepID=A0A5C1QGV1_9SPIO|nr:acetyltransferase [Oceanispirochaeta crateris]QEN06781.1 acetyltransferase [Oceanispirochaeta crateris]
MKIEVVNKTDYLTLICIWEKSVRNTHDFLEEGYIEELKPLILEHYFDAVDLRCAKDDAGIIKGFCGVQEGNIEMLFITPKYRGQGIGRALADYAVHNQGAFKVDVNEQNYQAVGFYKHFGFKVIGRSDLDGQGKPYPLLHMELGR